MDKSPFRVLVVDDYEGWRRYHSTTLSKEQGIQIIGEASSGPDAVQRAQELQPDLILLDIGLPTLNGIEAARRIRVVSPVSRILFVSENHSADIAEEALSTGAGGYVVKTDAAGELLPAVKAVLEGKRFVSAGLAGLIRPPDPQTGARLHRENVSTLIATQNAGGIRHHEVGFYSDDRHLLDGVTRFIGKSLRDGNSAIVIATESNRESLVLELQAKDLDIGTAIEEGRYIALDAADALSRFIVNGMPDPVRFLEVLGDLIMTAMEAAKAKHPRVSVFGECVHLLWAQGNVQAAIQMEKLGNKLTNIHAVDILCGYSPDRVESEMDKDVFEQICAEHSCVYSR